MPCWDFDDDTANLWPIGEIINGATFTDLNDGPQMASLGGNFIPNVIDGPDTGKARNWQAGNTSTWRANGVAATFSKATSSIWTLEFCYLQEVLPGEVFRFLFRNSAGTATIQIYPSIDGSFRLIFVSASGTTYDHNTAAYFPKTGWQHVRIVFDFGAGNVRFHAAPIGVVPVLFGTLSIDTSGLASNITKFDLGSGACQGVARIRISKVERTDAFPLLNQAPPADPPTFTAAYVAGRVVATFSRAVLQTDDLKDPAQYTVTPPGGGPAVTVTDVVVTSTTASLGISGDIRGGGDYSVALPLNLARAVDTGEGNAAASANFTIAPVALSVVSAVPLSSTRVRVAFTKPVKQVSAANSNDALNPVNYAITSAAGTLAVTSVSGVQPDTVDITTAAESPLQYSLTVSNVQDLAGNAI